MLSPLAVASWRIVMPSTPWAAISSAAAARICDRLALPCGARSVAALTAPLGMAGGYSINRLTGGESAGGGRAGRVPPVFFPLRFPAGLADGSVPLAFRRWRRPAAKAGGRQRTPVGELAIDAVDPVEVDEV